MFLTDFVYFVSFMTFVSFRHEHPDGAPGRVVVRRDDDPDVGALARLRVLRLVELTLRAGRHVDLIIIVCHPR